MKDGLTDLEIAIATGFRADAHRTKMYAVAPWDRRKVARNGGVKFESRDSNRFIRAAKAQSNSARRRADRVEALASLLA